MILARVDDKKQNKTVNMAEIVLFRGVREIQYVIFQQNNVNPYEIYNNYELSIVFHTKIIFLRNRKILFLPAILVISCMISF